MCDAIFLNWLPSAFFLPALHNSSLPISDRSTGMRVLHLSIGLATGWAVLCGLWTCVAKKSHAIFTITCA